MPSVPTQPSFLAGVVPNAAALNLIAQGVDALAAITIGKPTTAQPSGRPALKVVRNNPLTVTTGVTTVVPWEDAFVNTDGMWTNPAGAQVTIQTPGWYRIAAGISYDPGAKSLRICRIFVNGTVDPDNAVADSDVVMGNPTPNSCRVGVLTYEHLAVGSSVYLGAYQNSGADVVLDPVAKWGTWMALRWDAPY